MFRWTNELKDDEHLEHGDEVLAFRTVDNASASLRSRTIRISSSPVASYSALSTVPLR